MPVFSDKGRFRTYRETYDYLTKRASKGFSYVSKYATVKQLARTPTVSKNDDAVEGTVKMGPTDNNVATDVGKSNIQKVKAAKDVNTALSKVKVSEAAPTSVGVGGGNTEIANSVVSAAKVIAKTPGSKVDSKQYAETVKTEIADKIPQSQPHTWRYLTRHKLR